MFTAAILTRAKTWRQPKYASTEEWIKKTRPIYTMEYYVAPKKSGITPFATTCHVQLETITLSEVSQRRQIAQDINYVWDLKYDTKEPVYEIETDSWTQSTGWRLPRERGLGEARSGRWGLADISLYI